MSKQKPVKQDYTAQQIDKKLEKQRAKQKQKKKTARTIAALCCAGAVVIGAVTYASVKIYRKSGAHLQGIALESDHYQITNGMMSYAIDTTYQNYLESVKGNKNAERPIKGKSFKKQLYGTDQTWFDYLVEASNYSLEKAIKVCEAAQAEGFTLTDAQIAECEAEAQALDLSKYSDGVQASDAAEIIKIKRLAKEYQAYATENITVSEDELNSYYAENNGKYAKFGLEMFSIAWNGGTDENKNVKQDHDAASAEVEKLKACKTQDDFEKEIIRFLTEDQQKDAETAKKMAETSRMSLSGDSVDADAAEWILDSSRKVNDTFSIEHDNGDYFVVYMLTELPVTDQSDTVDLRLIGVNKTDNTDTVAVAQSLVDGWQADGGTESQFAEIAKEHSAIFNQISTGGLYIGFSENTMTYGEELRDWAFSADRKPGDTEIFDTDSLVVVAYYVADNPYSADKAAAYQELYLKQADAINTCGDIYTVTEHQNIINKLNY